MKAKAFKIVNLIIAVLVFVFALGNAFAWFAEDMRKSEDKFDGSSASPYFESGDGSENDPFILSSYNHLYNLAWLQNTGNLNDRYYYFQLKNDITMPDNFWLPPIGTDDYPFQGYFDGNNKKIINLKTTTDSSKLTSAVSGSSVKYSNAVGMFGMTAAHVGILIAKITNLNLITPVVEVASQNATYNTDSGSQATVGLAIGFANCGAENIGVYNGKLSVQKTGYTTVNSIIGGYDGSKVNGDQIDGEGANFGSSLDVDRLYNRLSLIYANKTSSNPSTFLPEVTLENSKPILSATYCMPLTVANDITSTVYSGSTAKETPSNQNVGYYCGNQSKIDSKTISFTTYNEVSAERTETITNEDGTTTEITVPYTIYNWNETGKTPNWFFKRVGSGNTYTSDDIQPLTEDEMAALPQAMRDFLPEGATSIEKNRIRLQNKFDYSKAESANASYYNHGTISYYGVEYADAQIPNTGIWLRTKNAGKMQFLVWSADNGQLFTLYRLARNGQDSNSALKDYFKADITQPANNIVELYSTNLPKYTLFYFEHEVGEGEEYLLGNSSGSNGVYFLYLDLGTSGSEGGSTVDDPKLANIDFIYDDGTNVILIGTSGFVATNVIFKFTTADITLLYFYRPENGKDSNSYTLCVDYNVEGNGTEPTFKTTGIGSCIKTKQPGLTSETLLTYPPTS